MKTYYYICVKCFNLFEDLSEIVTINSGYQMATYWCKECTAKHLNSSGVKI